MGVDDTDSGSSSMGSSPGPVAKKEKGEWRARMAGLTVVALGLGYALS